MMVIRKDMISMSKWMWRHHVEGVISFRLEGNLLLLEDLTLLSVWCRSLAFSVVNLFFLFSLLPFSYTRKGMLYISNNTFSKFYSLQNC